MQDLPLCSQPTDRLNIQVADLKTAATASAWVACIGCACFSDEA